jgi:hypothetical protein
MGDDSMEGKKKLGIVLLVLGIVVLILSLAADLIGIGVVPAFGYKQIAGVILGVVAGVAGLLFLRKTAAASGNS